LRIPRLAPVGCGERRWATTSTSFALAVDPLTRHSRFDVVCSWSRSP
jgi:hypothetical protein